MYDLANLSPKELDIIIRNTAVKKGLSQPIVEKDFWVSVILFYLFSDSPWRQQLAFKGGTSLSKAYNLIERFSEDIDLILDWRALGYNSTEPYASRSATQQDKFNKQMLERTQNFLETEFIPKMRNDLSSRLKKHLDISLEDDAVVIDYDSRYTKDKSILRAIRLEMGALAAWTPTQTAVISPYISEVYPSQFGDAKIAVRTTTPERTFWEKATILHREAFRPKGSAVPFRLSRHYYDLSQMSKLGVLDQALAQPELLAAVADFKAKFYPQKWAHYELARLGTLRLIPPEHSFKELERDYIAMLSMIYGKHPSFAELMDEISEIERLINAKA